MNVLETDRRHQRTEPFSQRHRPRHLLWRPGSGSMFTVPMCGAAISSGVNSNLLSFWKVGRKDSGVQHN